MSFVSIVDLVINFIPFDDRCMLSLVCKELSDKLKTEEHCRCLSFLMMASRNYDLLCPFNILCTLIENDITLGIDYIMEKYTLYQEAIQLCVILKKSKICKRIIQSYPWLNLTICAYSAGKTGDREIISMTLDPQWQYSLFDDSMPDVLRGIGASNSTSAVDYIESFTTGDLEPILTSACKSLNLEMITFLFTKELDNWDSAFEITFEAQGEYQIKEAILDLITEQREVNQVILLKCAYSSELDRSTYPGSFLKDPRAWDWNQHLITAIYNSRDDLALLCISNGANNFDDALSLQLTYNGIDDHQQLCSILVNRGGDSLGSSIEHAIITSNLDAINLMIDMNPLIKNEGLLISIRHKSIFWIKHFIDLGATNLKEGFKQTLYLKQPKLVELFLQRGMILDDRNCIKTELLCDFTFGSWLMAQKKRFPPQEITKPRIIVKLNCFPSKRRR